MVINVICVPKWKLFLICVTLFNWSFLTITCFKWSTPLRIVYLLPLPVLPLRIRLLTPDHLCFDSNFNEILISWKKTMMKRQGQWRCFQCSLHYIIPYFTNFTYDYNIFLLNNSFLFSILFSRHLDIRVMHCERIWPINLSHWNTSEKGNDVICWAM